MPLQGTGAFGDPAPVKNAKTVLVIDDDRDLLFDLSDALETAGYRSRLAEDGQKALDLLEHETPDLIVLDLRIPVVDGWTLSVWLKNQPRLRDVPLVVLSAVHVAPRVLDAMNEKGPYWLEKPCSPEQFLGVVDHHLRIAG